MLRIFEGLMTCSFYQSGYDGKRQLSVGYRSSNAQFFYLRGIINASGRLRRLKLKAMQERQHASPL